MIDIDQHLTRASKEIQDVTRRSAVPPTPAPTPSTRGWLVAAAAFVAVIVFGIIPMLAGPSTVEPGSPETPTTALATASTTEAQPATTVPEVSCSASGVEPPGDVAGLPSAVADTRAAIIEATSSCSLGEMAELGGEELNTSFGGGGFANIVRWEEEGRGELGTLLQVLKTSHAVIQTDGETDIYVWPAAFSYDYWEDIPAEHLEELLEFYTQDQLDQMSLAGGYLGWRVGIDDNGNWLFFIAGD